MSTPQTYKAYVSRFSYFSGKIEAYLRYKQIPFERIEVDSRISSNVLLPSVGMVQVPVLQTPDGQWLRDSTPMIDYLEKAHPQLPVLPQQPAQRFLAKLIEDYVDEWLLRTALYFRWQFPDDARLLGTQIARANLKGWPLPASWTGRYFAARQRRELMRGDGASEANGSDIESAYDRYLGSLQRILTDQRWLSGERPGLVDFAFFGPMFRHFSLDPTPADRMRNQAPAVYEWLARLWNRRDEDIKATIVDFVLENEGWDEFLSEICQVYLPYLATNSKAYLSGSRHFRFRPVTTNQDLLMDTVRYRVYCQRVLRHSYYQMEEDDRTLVAAQLSPYGGLAALIETDDIDSGMDVDQVLPIKAGSYSPTLWQKFKAATRGSPRGESEVTRRPL